MDIKGIDFVVYDVSDMARSMEFYRDKLGLELAEELGENNWAEFDIAGQTLALCGSVSREWGVPYAPAQRPEAGFKGEGAVALAVGDLDAALVELRTKGVEAEVGKRDSTVCYFAVVVDPDGNRVWLHQHYGH